MSVGLGGARKNHAGLLGAFARAALGREWLLVLAGSPGPAAEELRARAQALGIAEQVRFPGWTPGADLPVLLAGSRGYVCPSLHEGFGIPVAEAQACGVAVASSDRGGLPEVVGDAGLLFDPEDEPAFTRALQRLAGEPELGAELGRRGRERALRLFSWDAVAARMLEVYREATVLRRSARR
jgi:glycosyltransferase involved in cell wall biosynthesis